VHRFPRQQEAVPVAELAEDHVAGMETDADRMTRLPAAPSRLHSRVQAALSLCPGHYEDLAAGHNSGPYGVTTSRQDSLE
jgi:hypothetical protein